MAALKRCLPLFMVIAVCGACTTAVKEASDAPPRGGPTTSVFLLVDHWHAGVAIKVSDLPGNLVPEHRDFPAAEYLEFGWGDWDFYQAPNFNSGYALKALLFPTKSVMHMVASAVPSPIMLPTARASNLICIGPISSVWCAISTRVLREVVDVPRRQSVEDFMAIAGSVDAAHRLLELKPSRAQEIRPFTEQQ